jgi:hypothetical protein
MTDPKGAPQVYVRDQITAMLLERQPGSTPADIQESLLIRHGQFCGQKFNLAGWVAVWFVEENQIKIYRPDGSLQTTQSVGHVSRKSAA